MSSTLERRLQRAFGRVPQPTREVTSAARAAALATLPPAEQRRALPLVFAAAAIAAVVVGAGAAALAATGNLHVRVGQEPPPPPRAPAHLQVPRGTNGIAVAAAGRLWLVTRHGLRIEGMPVTAAELSPRALYAAVGVGSSLVALAPGRRAWSHEARGRVVAAAWSPDGLKIAYVVRRGNRNELRLIEGDGDHDRLLDDSRVSAAKPSWRSDALAVAYVRRDGRAAVYDFESGRGRVVDTRRCSGPALRVAYAPRARRLGVAGGSGVALLGRSDACISGAILARGFGWNAAGRVTGVGRVFVRPSLRAFATSPTGSRLLFALSPRRGVVEVLLGSPDRMRAATPLLRLHMNVRSVALSWR